MESGQSSHDNPQYGRLTHDNEIFKRFRIRDQQSDGLCWIYSLVNVLEVLTRCRGEKVCFTAQPVVDYFTPKITDPTHRSLLKIYEKEYQMEQAIRYIIRFGLPLLMVDEEVGIRKNVPNLSISPAHLKKPIKYAEFYYVGEEVTDRKKIIKFSGDGKELVEDNDWTEDYLMRRILEHGPMVMGFRVDGRFRRWSSWDIYTPRADGDIFQHAVVVLNSYVENNVNYWEILNSEGPQWGMGGFGRILRCPIRNPVIAAALVELNDSF